MQIFLMNVPPSARSVKGKAAKTVAMAELLATKQVPETVLVVLMIALAVAVTVVLETLPRNGGVQDTLCG